MELLETLIKNKTTCVFVSPHLDDAIFSAGELISKLSGKVEVIVINVFTSCGDGKNTLSAKSYLKQCGFKKAKSLYKERIKEDDECLSTLGVKIYNMGLVEALWRKRNCVNKTCKVLGKIFPEFDHMYPTYRLNIISGKASSEDKVLQSSIIKKINKILNNKNNYKIFCPVGFGNHVDHLIVRDACSDGFFEKTYFWADLPYSCDLLKKNDFVKSHHFEKEIWQVKEDKLELLKKYKTQMGQVIKDKGIYFKDEVFYFSSSIHSGLHVVSKKTLDNNLKKDWCRLWKLSPLKNYFNSPFWFEACKKSFGYKSFLLIACYNGKELVGILPLVKTKKYGIEVWADPGEKHFDKSSLLLAKMNSYILEKLLQALKKFGNYYLSEIESSIASDIFQQVEGLRFSQCSSSPFLPLANKPFRFLKGENRRRIEKVIKKQELRLKLKISTGSFKKNLSEILYIESKSLKFTEHKNIFSESQVVNLYENINKLNSRSLFISVLYFNNKPVCFANGFVYDKVYLGTTTAYNSDYSFLIPGKVCTYLLIEKLTELGFECLDFSRGKTEFKREFTPYSKTNYSIYYSDNLFTINWFSFLNFSKSNLEKNAKLYEIIRKIKLQITK